MKYVLITTFAILTIIPSLGQEIRKIIVTSQQRDEPPTKQGRPKYMIEFRRSKTGDLVAVNIRKNKEKIKPSFVATIDADKIRKVVEWSTQNKRHFTQIDLGISAEQITARAKTSLYKLNFDVPSDFSVNIDSFSLCRSYKLIRTVSTGGETIVVTFKSKSQMDKEFIFNSSNIGEDGFALQGFIFCYTVLVGRIPKEFPTTDFFAQMKLEDILVYYQKMAECEGYYYKEYTAKHPSMTSQDKRMMTGWNFVEYMRERNKK